MAAPIIMPRQGQSVESCIITKWHKAPGDKVAPGDLLFSYETDKAAFDEEAKTEGTVLAVFFDEGDDVPCLVNVMVIGAAGEPFAEFDPKSAAAGEAAATQAAPAPETEAAPMPADEALEAVQFIGKVKISPRAKALLERRHAILERIVPSGPDGRIIERDVQAALDAGHATTGAAGALRPGANIQGTGLGGRVTLADMDKRPLEAPAASAAAPAAAPSAPAADEATGTWEEPLTRMRKVIGKAMSASLASTAQLTHNMSFDATAIQAARKLFKEKGAAFGLEKVTLNDIVLFAVAKVLARPEHKALNANLVGERMIYFRGVQLGVAVDTERGLMVPTIGNAERLSLRDLSQAAKKLAGECQAGTINPDLLKGGSFTVSNLGVYGVESFTPVINPPQTGILGVNAISTRVREEDGALKAYPAMGLSLTYDHRALDGAPASRFLRDLCAALENFNLLLAL